MASSSLLGWETEAENAETHLPKIRLEPGPQTVLESTRAAWLWSHKSLWGRAWGPSLLCGRLKVNQRPNP